MNTSFALAAVNVIFRDINCTRGTIFVVFAVLGRITIRRKAVMPTNDAIVVTAMALKRC